MGVRTSLAVNRCGSFQEIDKHTIMQRTSLPARDLRLLDPLLDCTSTILVRDGAILVNMEHIRAIITAQEFILVNHKDPLVASLVDKLIEQSEVPLEEQEGGPKVLPFEFRALEACLESVCNWLNYETVALEQETHPILDELTNKINTLNVKTVRLIKSRLVAVFGRVHKVRDEIEQLLDDDQDMAEMYLSNKWSLETAVNTADAQDKSEDLEKDDEDDKEEAESKDLLQPERKKGTITDLDVEELQMLLEAYFMNIDGTLNKLCTLKESVDDTEDYIKIMLDDKHNQMRQMGVRVAVASLAVNASIAVSGVFGMNIFGIGLFDNNKSGLPQFLGVTIGSLVGCLLLYFLIIAYCKQRRLLQ